jgi:hypothetical protein
MSHDTPSPRNHRVAALERLAIAQQQTIQQLTDRLIHMDARLRELEKVARRMGWPIVINGEDEDEH